MKKILSALLLVFVVSSLSAKKVKFAVDMGTYTINPNGIHVIGDFQVIAGFGTLDWDPATTPLTQEGTSSIYSIVVDIPAFQKYEFKFVNGIFTYEAEFVPEEARVGYNFNDNRWLYVDSLANDTTYSGAVVFSANAPASKYLIRYKVDLTNEGTVSSNGVHVATSYQAGGFDPSKIRLYSFGSGVYEIINYVDTNSSNSTYTYKFYNGNNAATTETVPGSCAVAGDRSVTVPKDTVLPLVCFSGCSACIPSSVKENALNNEIFTLFPNPANNMITINNTETGRYHMQLFDNTGKLIMHKKITTRVSEIDTDHLGNGVYFVRLYDSNGLSQMKKLIILH